MGEAPTQLGLSARHNFEQIRGQALRKTRKHSCSLSVFGNVLQHGSCASSGTKRKRREALLVLASAEKIQHDSLHGTCSAFRSLSQ